MPINARRRGDFIAAVAYDRDHPDAKLPRHAARLLALMFPSEDVCQRSQEALRKGSAETGFPRCCGALSRPGSCRGTGWPGCPTRIGCTSPRCSHEGAPREGVRPGRAVPLDRNAKARIAAYAKVLERPQPSAWPA
jgi:hypothetical protein